MVGLAVVGLDVVGVDVAGVEVVGVEVVGDANGLAEGLSLVGEGLGALVGIDVGHGPTTSQAYCHAPP